MVVVVMMPIFSSTDVAYGIQGGAAALTVEPSLAKRTRQAEYRPYLALATLCGQLVPVQCSSPANETIYPGQLRDHMAQIMINCGLRDCAKLLGDPQAATKPRLLRAVPS
jgi:hypothetical protein